MHATRADEQCHKGDFHGQCGQEDATPSMLSKFQTPGRSSLAHPGRDMTKPCPSHVITAAWIGGSPAFIAAMQRLHLRFAWMRVRMPVITPAASVFTMPVESERDTKIHIDANKQVIFHCGKSPGNKPM